MIARAQKSPLEHAENVLIAQRDFFLYVYTHLYVLRIITANESLEHPKHPKS